MAKGAKASWDDSSTQPCTHQFINSTNDKVEYFWVDSEGVEHSYGTLEPGHATTQATYTTHLWYLRGGPNAQLLGECVGPNAACEVFGPGKCTTKPLDLTFTPPPEWGQWRVRAVADCGVPILAYDCVDQAAAGWACHILRNMLRYSPPSLIQNMVQAKACVGIIGKCQVTTDMPGHTHLKLNRGGRDMDGSTRGLGGTKDCPMCTCGEENLTMQGDTRYACENILIHEMAHTVMELGMTDEQRATVHNLYHQAREKGAYGTDCYAMENADEYWAEGTQAWYGATVRTDVNGGINSRAKLYQYDPDLAAFMTQIYGNNPWQYTDDSPAKFDTSSDAAKPVKRVDSARHSQPAPQPYPPPGYAYPTPGLPVSAAAYGPVGVAAPTYAGMPVAAPTYAGMPVAGYPPVLPGHAYPSVHAQPAYPYTAAPHHQAGMTRYGQAPGGGTVHPGPSNGCCCL